MLLSFFIIRVPLCRAELTLQHDLLELGLFYFFLLYKKKKTFFFTKKKKKKKKKKK